VDQVLADGEFIFQLLDEANILIRLSDDVFQSENLLGDGITDGVNRAAGALSDKIDQVVPEQRSGAANFDRHVRHSKSG
jgi:hypothetical protein